MVSDWLAGSVICTLSAVDRVSFVFWSYRHCAACSCRVDAPHVADFSSTDLAGLHGDTVGRCATQDCVILLGDLDDGLLVTTACTFLVNYVVSWDPLGLV